MKIPSRILTGAALFAAVLSPSFAQTATTKPVGYRTETLKGGGAFNLFSPNLDNAVGAAGTIDTIAGAVLTDNEANFTAAFTAGEPVTIKITSGANAGITADVTSFTATTLTTAQDISAALTAGVSYEARKTPTIASTFGAANSAGLAEGNTSNADVIWIPKGDGTYTRVYRSSGGLSGVGWRFVGAAGDAAAFPIAITDAVFIERRGATDLPIVFTGHVQTTATKTGVISGFNPLSRVIPVGLTLTDSQLQTEIQQGNSTNSDVVWNPKGDGTYDRYFYSNGGLSGVGWRIIGGAGDQGAVQLKSGFLIERKQAAGTNVTIRIPSGLDL